MIKENQDSSNFRTASGFQEFIKDGKYSLTEDTKNKKTRVILKRKRPDNK